MESLVPVALQKKVTRASKDASITDIRGYFDKMSSAVFVDFTGMTVENVTKLRAEFRKAGVDYKVVKNTLVKQALKDVPYLPGLKSTLVGMTGVAWSYEDPSAAAKIVKAFKKEADGEKLKVKGGVIDGQVIDGKSVEESLASMPGKQELRAMLLATFQAPSQNFVALLNAPAQNFAYLLTAKKEQG